MAVKDDVNEVRFDLWKKIVVECFDTKVLSCRIDKFYNFSTHGTLLNLLRFLTIRWYRKKIFFLFWNVLKNFKLQW